MSTFIRGDLPRDEAVKILTLQDVAQRGLTDSWPAPRWIKVWKDGEPLPVMAWLNGAYAGWYNIDPREYIGKPDSLMWPLEAADSYHELDREAIQKAGTIVAALEHTPRGHVKSSIVRKFAFRVDDSGISGWGIYGEICPLEIGICEMCELERGT